MYWLLEVVRVRELCVLVVQLVVELRQPEVRLRKLLLGPRQFAELLVEVGEQQGQDDREKADEQHVVLQRGFRTRLLGLVGGVDDRVELGHLRRAELYVAEQCVVDGGLRVLEGVGEVAGGIAHPGERLQGGVLLGGVADVGDRRETVVFQGEPVVVPFLEEAAERIGDLGVMGRVRLDLSQQLGKQRLRLVEPALADEPSGPVGAVGVGGGIEHHHQRIAVQGRLPVVFLLVADGGVVAEKTVVGLVIERQKRRRQRFPPGSVQNAFRLDALSGKGVELCQPQPRGVGLRRVVQLPGDGEVPFGVADGRVEFVFPELVAQPGVDFILLPGESPVTCSVRRSSSIRSSRFRSKTPLFSST